jgi:hypothetical protein
MGDFTVLSRMLRRRTYTREPGVERTASGEYRGEGGYSGSSRNLVRMEQRTPVYLAGRSTVANTDSRRLLAEGYGSFPRN